MIVGIGGLYGAGKDAVSDYLVDNYDWVKFGMSDALNDALLKLNPLVPVKQDDPEPDAIWAVQNRITAHVRYDELYASVGYVEAKKNPEVRRLLQVLGTEVGRNMIDDAVWVNIAKRRVLDASRNRDVILTGIRYPNEQDMIRSIGGDLWWVDRPGFARAAGGTQHSSETTLSSAGFDQTIRNDGTLNDLYIKIDDLINRTPSHPKSVMLF